MWRQFCLQLELCSPTQWLFQSFQICKRFATIFPTFYKSQLTGFFYFVNFVQSCFSLFFSGAQIPLHCSSNREVVSKSHNHEKFSFWEPVPHYRVFIKLPQILCRTSPFFGLLFAVFVFYISVTVLSVLLIVFSIWF